MPGGITGYFPGIRSGEVWGLSQHRSHNGAAPFFRESDKNKANKAANAAASQRKHCARTVQKPTEASRSQAPRPHQTPLCVRSQLSAMLSWPGPKAASRNAAPKREVGARVSYLGDGLLVPHDSLLDECVDLNVSVPARHHHPGPAEAHGDFHGWRIPDWRPLASEQKRGEQREERSARGGGRSMGYKFGCPASPSQKRD